MNSFFPDFQGWSTVSEPPPEALTSLVPNLTWGDDLKMVSQILPFYPDSQFLMGRAPSWTPPFLAIYALVEGDDVCWLNGTSPPLHAFNRKGHLSLSQDMVLPYLQFFSFFVRGGEGPFYVIDSPRAPYLPVGIRAGTEAPDLTEVQKRFQECFQSPREFSTSPYGKWRLSATVYYSNAVFVADFLVSPGGMVEMEGDFPVLTDLPVKISAPIVPEPTEQSTLH